MPGDLAAFNLPSIEELRKMNWSFDIDKLRDQFTTTSDLEATIRIHLYLENTLIVFLREALPFHEALSVDRVPFGMKVEFCAALGLVPLPLVGVLKKINELRNKVAHDLHYTISLQDKRDLFSLMPAYARELVEENGHLGKKFELTEIPIAHFIAVAMVLIDLGRQQYIEWKQKREAAFQQAKDLLTKIKGSPPETK